MRDALRAVVARSFGIQFSGEPIKNISVLELLPGSRDQLRKIHSPRYLRSEKMMMFGSGLGVESKVRVRVK